MKNLNIPNKETYLKPEYTVISIESEGLICGSDSEVGINNAKINDFIDGETYDIFLGNTHSSN